MLILNEFNQCTAYSGSLCPICTFCHCKFCLFGWSKGVTWGVCGWGEGTTWIVAKLKGGMQAGVSDGVEGGESGRARAPPSNHASARWANIFVNM